MSHSYGFDFTKQGRRPSAAQVVKAWRDAGKPDLFTVEYGETFAEFELVPGGPMRGWQDSGNGCRGVDRLAVVRLLDHEERAKETAARMGLA